MHLSREGFAVHSEAKMLAVVSGRPQYDTTVRFVVDMERLLAEHDGSSCLALRLQHSTGYVSKPLGAACVSLQDFLRDVQPSLTASQQGPSQAVQVVHTCTSKSFLPSSFACDTHVHCRLPLHLPYDLPQKCYQQNLLYWLAASMHVHFCDQLQVLGNHGEVLGAITYSVSTHYPMPSGQQAAQRVQPPSQAQPEMQQHDSSLPAAVIKDDCSDSSNSSVAPIQSASFGGQSQPRNQAAAADAVSHAAASQDSTALTAFGRHRRTASKHDVPAPLAHGQQGTEAVSSSLDEDPDADSLISSSSGVLFDNMPQHLDVCRCRSATMLLLHCICVEYGQAIIS